MQRSFYVTLMGRTLHCLLNVCKLWSSL